MEAPGEGGLNPPTVTPPDDGNPQISVSECAHDYPLASLNADSSAAADLPRNQDTITSTSTSANSPGVLSSSAQQAHWSSLPCEGYEEVGMNLQEEHLESEKILLHTSTEQGHQTETVLQTKVGLQPEMNTVVPPASLHCYSQEGTEFEPTEPTKACNQKVIDSVTSEHSFGEQILKAWTDGIMTISTNSNPELRETSRADASLKSPESVETLLPSEAALTESSVELPQPEDGSDVTSTAPADVEDPPGSLPPLLLRPSMITFACEEREEHLLQDSDSELEMTPECELQLQVSGRHARICSQETESTPPRKKENLGLPVDDTHCLQPPPPPPPPPPPMFQHSLSKRDTMLCPCADTTSKVEPPTAKCGGGFGLQSFFESSSIELVRPLHSMTFGPLGTLKLTQRLKLGVQNISANVSTQPQPNELTGGLWDASNEGSHRDSSPEPPSKKPRHLANVVIPMVEGSVPCDNLTCAVTEEYTCGIEMYPLPGLQHPNWHQSLTTTISHTDQVQQNPTSEATVPVISSPPEAMISQFEPGRLEYPHQPSECADDGQDTVYQAVPTECARDHALVPNIAPCGNESEDRRDNDRDDTNGGNELEVPVDQHILSNNSPFKHLSDDGQMKVSEFPYLDEQREQLSSSEMSQVLKVTLTPIEVSPAPMYTAISELSTESVPSLPTVHHHQLVPEDPLNSSFTIHSLYEQPEAVKEQKADPKLCTSLEDMDIDELDGPTVVALALESIETRHKTVSEESREQVPRSPALHWSSAYASYKMSSGGLDPKNLPGEYVFEFVYL